MMRNENEFHSCLSMGRGSSIVLTLAALCVERGHVKVLSIWACMCFRQAARYLSLAPTSTRSFGSPAILIVNGALIVASCSGSKIVSFCSERHSSHVAVRNSILSANGTSKCALPNNSCFAVPFNPDIKYVFPSSATRARRYPSHRKIDIRRRR